MIIDEKSTIEVLRKAKKVLLLEPDYIRQYPPLALAKISSFVKSNGGEVEFSREWISKKFDLICITTLFTTDSKTVVECIKSIKSNFFTKDIPILIGGIFASLMPEYIDERFKSAMIYKGYSKVLDEYIPDYSIDWKTKHPWDNACITFTTRGCPNKCGYCMVWRMEPEFYIEKNWKKSILDNDKEIALISDNNFLSSNEKHITDVCDVLSKSGKKVIFNNGVDVRIMTEEKANNLAKIKFMSNGYQGLRFAFDRMEDDGYYQKACELMIKKLDKKNLASVGQTYVLFNFTDTPQEAYYRAQECWKYRSYPYLMQFRPLNLLSKKNTYVGKHWTKNLSHAFKTWGQMNGFNTGDRTFETWIKSNKSKVKLNDEDWDKWFYKR